MTAFPSGVASGDPRPDALVLWTRVEAPADRAPRHVGWSIGPDGAAPTASGRSLADERGFVTVRVTGLRPGTRYRYRFSVDDRTAEGVARTLPRTTDAFHLAVACCARRPLGDFDAYRAIAEADPDLVLHLGDYIYEDGGGGPRGDHDPPWECVTEADYRRRYRQYRSDVDLQAAHAGAAWVGVWDDHEVANDGWRSGAPDAHRWHARMEAACNAHRDWFPHGDATGPTRLDRVVDVGDLARIVVVDTRFAGRTAPAPDLGGPALIPARPRRGDRIGRRLLTDEQWAWLGDTIGGCETPWLVLATSVQLAPLRLARLPTPTWPPRRGVVVNPGQWDGYPSERERLIDLVRARRARPDPPGVFALSGDLHARFWVPRPGPDHLAEMTTPSVRSATFGRQIRRRLPVPSPALAWWLRRLNPHFGHLDLDEHGATSVRLTPDLAEFGPVGRGADDTPLPTWRLERSVAIGAG